MAPLLRENLGASPSLPMASVLGAEGKRWDVGPLHPPQPLEQLQSEGCGRGWWTSAETPTTPTRATWTFSATSPLRRMRAKHESAATWRRRCCSPADYQPTSERTDTFLSPLCGSLSWVPPVCHHLHVFLPQVDRFSMATFLLLSLCRSACTRGVLPDLSSCGLFGTQDWENFRTPEKREGGEILKPAREGRRPWNEMGFGSSFLGSCRCFFCEV